MRPEVGGQLQEGKQMRKKGEVNEICWKVKKKKKKKKNSNNEDKNGDRE